MRTCERCHCEMITDGIRFVASTVGGSGRGMVVVENVNTRNKGPNAIEMGSLIEKMIDKTYISDCPVNTSVAVCPNCGKVERYLSKDELKEFNKLTNMQV